MTTSRQKAIGSAAERDIATKVGGRRVGMDYGPIDVVSAVLDLQVKATTIPLSLNQAHACIDRIPLRGDRLRGLVQVSRPGAGRRARRTIVFDFDEFCQWYGNV